MSGGGFFEHLAERAEQSNQWLELTRKKRLQAAAVSFLSALIALGLVSSLIYSQTHDTTIFGIAGGLMVLAGAFLGRLALNPGGAFRVAVRTVHWLFVSILVGAAVFVILLMVVPGDP